MLDIDIKELDFNQIKKQILTSFRGAKSQNWMSQRLGYTYNQYGKWESDLKRLYWSDFCQLCNLKKIPLNSIILKIYNIALPEDDSKGSALLKSLLNSYFSGQIEALEEYLKASKSTLRRWLSLKQDVPVEVVFQVLAYRPQLFLLFIHELKEVKLSEDLEKKIKDYLILYSIESEIPYIGGIQAYINTEEYKKIRTHSDHKIAEFLGLSLEQVKKGLEISLRHKTLKFNGQKYELNTMGVEYKGIPAADLVRTLKYWNYKSICYLENRSKLDNSGEPRSIAGYRVVAISKKLSDKISQKLSETYSDISRMILEDESAPEIVRVMTMNFFNINDAKIVEFETHPEFGFIAKTPKDS